LLGKGAVQSGAREAALGARLTLKWAAAIISGFMVI
jgi:hypothetical protein